MPTHPPLTARGPWSAVPRFRLVLLSLLTALATLAVQATAPPAGADGSVVTTASAADATSLTIYAEQVLAAAHDEVRREQGGPEVAGVGTTELIWSSELATLARRSSERMAGLVRLDHDPAIRDALCCDSRFSNNIGVSSSSTGAPTAAQVRSAAARMIDLWLDSPSHRDNLLDPKVTHLGIGVHLDADGRLWATVVFQDRALSNVSAVTTPPAADPWCPVTAPSGRFLDVANVHGPAIDCLAELGVVQGVSTDLFDPTGTITRGQVALLLDRALGFLDVDRPAALAGAFVDVPASRANAAAIERLAGAGIVLGRPDGRFGASDPVTRGQLAAQLESARRSLHGEVVIGPRGRFPDVPSSRRFARSIDAGANAGLLAGGDDGRFEPDAPLRRDQAASVVARFLAAELR
ncbi:MAG: S-layer homology domain-containing protein [Nitriliruptoraceae bacterium]